MAAGYHDFVAGEVLTAANLEDYCQNQSVMRFADATTRDTALTSVKTEGMVSTQADLNTLTVYSGTAWSTIGPIYGALTGFTPTVSQSTSPTWTTNRAAYTRTGRFIQGDFQITVASGTGTGANDVLITLPVASASSYLGNSLIGEVSLLDSSAGLYYFGALAWISTTTAKAMIRTNAAGQTYLGTTSFTAALATSDVISCRFHYEAGADA